MKLNISILFLLINILFAQDRTYLFYATPSGSGEGWEISSENSFSQKFPITSYPLNEDYMLERIHIYYILEGASANIQIKIRQDNNGSPGEALDGASWDITLQGHGGGLSGIEEYIFYTTSDCVLLEEDNYYWISLNSTDENSQIKWAHTSGSYYNYSISHDSGENWSPSETGFGGAGKISGEAVYYAPEINYNTYENGDVNLDGGLNVLDVVALSSFILGNIEFNAEQIEIGDFNQDGGNNILDVVGLVNEILNPTILNWTLQDINPNSNSYSQMIGPPIYLAEDKITGYYFGKAG